jgi:hypothetical protein
LRRVIFQTPEEFMNIEAVAEKAAYRTLKLPAFGTPVPHLGGTFWTLMRAKPGSGQEDYALVVPHGPEFEIQCAWGGYDKDEKGAACMWDGLANTRALVASKHEHPAAQFCASLCLPADVSPELLAGPMLHLPSLRELKALFAVGCDAFSDDGWYWSSTQFSRITAFYQYFGDGYTNYDLKSWEGGRARAVRRCSIESLIP